QRESQAVRVDPEQRVDAWRLDVGVDDADPMAAQRQPGGEVGREVRLAGAAAIGMGGNDLGHFVLAVTFAAGSGARPASASRGLNLVRIDLARCCSSRK